MEAVPPTNMLDENTGHEQKSDESHGPSSVRASQSRVHESRKDFRYASYLIDVAFITS